MKKLNLCEILKGHEDGTFYSPVCGHIRLAKINIKEGTLLFTKGTFSFTFLSDGRYYSFGETCIFPSKDQRDWNKWDKENNHRVPKTWSELVKIVKVNGLRAEINTIWGDVVYTGTCRDTLIEKSALALLKIHQLIEVGYGGNITKEDYINDEWIYAIIYSSSSNNLEIIKTCHGRYNNIAFYNKEQADEFLSHSENVQLLKDYFMI